MCCEGQSPDPNPGLPDLRTKLFTLHQPHWVALRFWQIFKKILTKYLRNVIRQLQLNLKQGQKPCRCLPRPSTRGEGALCQPEYPIPLWREPSPNRRAFAHMLPTPRGRLRLPLCLGLLSKFKVQIQAKRYQASLQTFPWHYTEYKLFSSAQRLQLGEDLVITLLNFTLSSPTSVFPSV